MAQHFRSLWYLDPSVAYLNHGSYGACPRAVLHLQRCLQMEMEREPVDFLSRQLPGRLQPARIALASFLGVDAADLVFVPSATAGVNAVLRSLEFAPGDELLATSHTYAACRKTLEYVAARAGARVVTAALPFPVRDDEEIVAAVLACVSPRTRLALVDHVTSLTALILPIAPLVNELRARGIETLVDGAARARCRSRSPSSVPPITRATPTSGCARPGGGVPARAARPAGRPPPERYQPRLQRGLSCRVRLDPRLRSESWWR